MPLDGTPVTVGIVVRNGIAARPYAGTSEYERFLIGEGVDAHSASCGYGGRKQFRMLLIQSGQAMLSKAAVRPSFHAEFPDSIMSGDWV